MCRLVRLTTSCLFFFGGTSEWDDFCQKILKTIREKQTGTESFRVHGGLLCYFPKHSRRRRWVVPPTLRSMVLKYFHHGELSAHVRAWKTYHNVASNFLWFKMRWEVSNYVRKSDLCQRAKPA